MWITECEETFLKLKEYLVAPPMLCKPQMGVPLWLYFAVTDRAINDDFLRQVHHFVRSNNCP